MATQNLFEKYGIKEVADVTFYRIEKKEETYESQREFNVGSVLKGAVELRTVYPMVDGVGSDEGFEAYVFTDADVITGTNYDCDDSITATITVKGKFSATDATTDAYEENDEYKVVTPKEGDSPSEEGWYEKSGSTYTQSSDNTVVSGKTYYEKITVGSFKESFTKAYTFAQLKSADDIAFTAGYPIYLNDDTQIPVASSVVDEDYTVGNTTSTTIEFKRVSYNLNKKTATYTFKVVYTNVTLTNSEDTATGVYDDSTAQVPDADLSVGTHEFTYPQQAFMLFARRQNLIAKTGTRYQFGDVDSLMGNLAFYDEYAASPNSVEKVVILGIAGSTGYSATSYDLEEINEALKGLTQSYKAKAYDVSYGTYAELVVEDEMGYYNPKFLGNTYNKTDDTIEPFVDSTGTVADACAEYREWSTDNRGCDIAIANATMWGNDVHYSINDAIDALKQKKLLLDAAESSGLAGIDSIFGGYKVTSDADPAVTTEDVDTTYNDNYSYSAGGTDLDTTSKYSLASVLDALTEIGYNATAIGQNIRVNFAENASNRAIYVQVSGAIDSAAGAYIYLLHNKNFRKLAADEAGIFSFEDKNGNTLYYQDKIFKKVEWLALVIIGDKGLIYVVNRHGTKAESRVAWMVNENGYINDAKAAMLVRNGLIHTTYITANDETFEATAEVIGMKTRKVLKKVNRYTPVLFLDTLKVSNIEQTAEETYAEGGRGNGRLIGWDFGKEITLTLQDALFTPASMSATFGSYEGNDFRKGVKDVKMLDRMEPVTAKRNFIVPAGNANGTPTEADNTPQAVYINKDTMEPYPDGTPIAEGETFLKWTRSVAYEGNSLGHKIEISADKFPGTYKIVGDTFVRSKETGEDERFQFVIPQAKMGTDQTIELSTDGDPSVFDMSITVLRPDNGVMMEFIQYNVVENVEEDDGSTMVKGTENLNLLDDAELFKVSTEGADEDAYIGATEY